MRRSSHERRPLLNLFKLMTDVTLGLLEQVEVAASEARYV